MSVSRWRPAPSMRCSGSAWSSRFSSFDSTCSTCGDADDRVQRRAQLVRHAGEELGFVAVRDFELAALGLDLLEQPHVLDRDHGLIGEGLEQFDLLGGERLHVRAAQADDARALCRPARAAP